MTRHLRLLCVDDPLGSVRTLVSALGSFGFAPRPHEVTTPADFDDALEDGPWDALILGTMHPDDLADVALDRLGGDPASPPMILVTPTEVTGRDIALLEAVRRGAADYVGSPDVQRFVAAIERETRPVDGSGTGLTAGPDQAGAAALRAGIVGDQVRLLGMQKMEAIGRLAGGIAHDFNNIVQAIGGFSETLLRDLDESDSRRQPVLEIQRAGDQAASLTRQLLAFSRQQVLQPRVLELNETVGTIHSLARRLIGEDIELRVSLAPGLRAVWADATQIEQVLMNLVVNGRDAMPAGGTITIETANTTLADAGGGEPFSIAPGPYVRLTVSDTGVGMSPEVKARAFEPFFTTKPLGRGTGLGLSTVYGIVKQSGGYIWIDAEPGQGTRVRIYLPQAGQPAGLEDPRPSSGAGRRGRETLLIVEDETGVRELIRDWLQSVGYQVLAAGTGADALQVSGAHDGPIDLLVADVVMPAMGGPALARHLTPIRPELKIMYMSGYANLAHGERGLLEPAIPFLQKPFTLSSLVAKIREVLDR